MSLSALEIKQSAMVNQYCPGSTCVHITAQELLRTEAPQSNGTQSNMSTVIQCLLTTSTTTSERKNCCCRMANDCIHKLAQTIHGIVILKNRWTLARTVGGTQSVGRNQSINANYGPSQNTPPSRSYKASISSNRYAHAL